MPVIDKVKAKGGLDAPPPSWIWSFNWFCTQVRPVCYWLKHRAPPQEFEKNRLALFLHWCLLCGVVYLFVLFFLTFFLHLHLADAFIQSDLQLHSGYTFLSVYVFPGNRTLNLLRCWRNALPLSNTGTLLMKNKYSKVEYFNKCNEDMETSKLTRS